MKFARITFEATPDNPDSYPVSVDAILDKKNCISSKAVLFGVDGPCGDGGGERYPFTLHADGTIDYGSGYSDDREAKCDLRERPIKLGARVCIWGASVGGNHFYRITSIQPMGCDSP